MMALVGCECVEREVEQAKESFRIIWALSREEKCLFR